MLAHMDPARSSLRSPPEEPERLIIVSNRGPIQHAFTEAGRMTRIETSGGVATALASVAAAQPVTWLASPGSDADRMLAIAGRGVPLGSGSRLRFVDVPDHAYDLFYEAFCNPTLWFIQHGLADRLQRDLVSATNWQAWEQGYRLVNTLFADAIVEQLDEDGADRVMLHDYHFYLAPQMVRARRAEVTLQHFIHIPWPAPHLWDALPRAMVASICRGLLGNDSLVFQTDASVENFLATCAIYLRGEATVSPVQGEVRYGRQVTTVWSNPISVDARALRDEVASPEGEAYRVALRRQRAEKTIVRVDRLDPSKDITGGFRAFERLLETHPEWAGKTRFLAFLVPSRDSIPEYRAYEDETFALVDAINARFGRDGWQPVKVYHEHNRLQALAALTMSDVLLVNSLADGMNLVSKEGAILNQCDGVLVLSDGAGSHEELRCGALEVKAGDVAGTAEALDRALRMSAGERCERATSIRECVERHQIHDWLRMQLKDLTITDYVKALAPAATKR